MDVACTDESARGTNRTNRTGLTMSVDRGRPEVIFQGREDRFYPVRKSAFAQTLKIAPRPPASQPSKCQRERFLVTLREQCGPPARTNLRRNSVRASHDQSGSTHCWLPLVAAR